MSWVYTKPAKNHGFDFYSVCTAHFLGIYRDWAEYSLNEMNKNTKPRIFGRKKNRGSLEDIYAHYVPSTVKKNPKFLRCITLPD